MDMGMESVCVYVDWNCGSEQSVVDALWYTHIALYSLIWVFCGLGRDTLMHSHALNIWEPTVNAFERSQ